MRCVHEASRHDVNCFITLTYNDENMPENGQLEKKHFQDFMKRLRRANEPHKIRFFAAGEYGEVCVKHRDRNCSVCKFGRPHFHACLFGFDFLDKKYFKDSNGVPLFTSEHLEERWEHKGFATVGSLTFESAAYTARYVLKKITGDHAYDHYECMDTDTGELFMKQSEFCTMSRRPGVGREWLDEFGNETFKDDFVVLRGIKMRPPRYYDEVYKIDNPEKFEVLKDRRKAEAKARAHDNTPQRLEAREKVKQAQLGMLHRSLDK